MKKIYSFTLSSDEYPSSSRIFADDLRLIAYIVYCEIYNYYGEDYIVLDVNNNIEYNKLNENCHKYKYRFDSDLYDDGYIYYEPFIVGDDTFCFTIVDDEFTIDNIMQIFQYVLNLLKMNYNMSFNIVSYVARDIDDERYRNVAINTIFNRLGYKNNRKNRLMYMIMNSVRNKKRIRDKNRKCFDYY